MNPYTPKLQKARAKLAKIERQQASLTMPGTFVTGRSGVSATRARKLDAQLDRTIDLAKAWVATNKRIAELERLEEAFAAGKIYYGGQPIKQAKAKKNSAPSKNAERAKLLAKALFDIDIDGEVTIAGHRIRSRHRWNPVQYDLEGWIIVDYPDGRKCYHKTKSPQGIRMEEKQTAVIKALLNWQA